VNFDDLKRLSRGLHRIDGKEFQAVLEESIGASREYARNCFPRFRDDPIGYMASRQPTIQGEKLLELAWKKGEEP
jgi:hypothetical protein